MQPGGRAWSEGGKSGCRGSGDEGTRRRKATFRERNSEIPRSELSRRAPIGRYEQVVGIDERSVRDSRSRVEPRSWRSNELRWPRVWMPSPDHRCTPRPGAGLSMLHPRPFLDHAHEAARPVDSLRTFEVCPGGQRRQDDVESLEEVPFLDVVSFPAPPRPVQTRPVDPVALDPRLSVVQRPRRARTGPVEWAGDVPFLATLFQQIDETLGAAPPPLRRRRSRDSGAPRTVPASRASDRFHATSCPGRGT